MLTSDSLTKTGIEIINYENKATDEKVISEVKNYQKIISSFASFVLITTPISAQETVSVTSEIKMSSSFNNSRITNNKLAPMQNSRLTELDRNESLHNDFVNINKLMKQNKEKEMKKMQNEILNSVISFESFVTKLGFVLTFLFTLLSLPFLIGYPAFLGIVMSMGLPIFVKIRRWERGERL